MGRFKTGDKVRIVSHVPHADHGFHSSYWNVHMENHAIGKIGTVTAIGSALSDMYCRVYIGDPLLHEELVGFHGWLYYNTELEYVSTIPDSLFRM
jgi:hypothetical protein